MDNGSNRSIKAVLPGKKKKMCLHIFANDCCDNVSGVRERLMGFVNITHRSGSVVCN